MKEEHPKNTKKVNYRQYSIYPKLFLSQDSLFTKIVWNDNKFYLILRHDYNEVTNMKQIRRCISNQLNRHSEYYKQFFKKPTQKLFINYNGTPSLHLEYLKRGQPKLKKILEIFKNHMNFPPTKGPTKQILYNEPETQSKYLYLPFFENFKDLPMPPVQIFNSPLEYNQPHRYK